MGWTHSLACAGRRRTEAAPIVIAPVSSAGCASTVMASVSSRAIGRQTAVTAPLLAYSPEPESKEGPMALVTRWDEARLLWDAKGWSIDEVAEEVQKQVAEGKWPQ